MQSGKHESSEISLALRNNWIANGEWLRGTPAREDIWNEEKDMINTKKLHWKHREGKRMQNIELVASLASSWESPDKNMKEKNGGTSIGKMDNW